VENYVNNNFGTINQNNQVNAQVSNNNNNRNVVQEINVPARNNIPQSSTLLDKENEKMNTNPNRNYNNTNKNQNNTSPNRNTYDRVINENPINYKIESNLNYNDHSSSNMMKDYENNVLGQFKNSYLNQAYDMQAFQSKILIRIYKNI